MTLKRMDQIGIVVDDLPAAIEFIVQLGLELRRQMPVEGRWVDRIVGLDSVQAPFATCLSYRYDRVLANNRT